MLMERLSQRKTPANPSRKGTTALLKTLLERLFPLRPMMGFPLKRQIGSVQDCGLSSQGIFGREVPERMCITTLPFLMNIYFETNCTLCRADIQTR